MEAIELETKELLEDYHDAEEDIVRNYGSEWKAGESFLLEGCKDSAALLLHLRVESKIVQFFSAVELVLHALFLFISSATFPSLL